MAGEHIGVNLHPHVEGTVSYATGHAAWQSERGCRMEASISRKLIRCNYMFKTTFLLPIRTEFAQFGIHALKAATGLMFNH